MSWRGSPFPGGLRGGGGDWPRNGAMLKGLVYEKGGERFLEVDLPLQVLRLCCTTLGEGTRVRNNPVIFGLFFGFSGTSILILFSSSTGGFEADLFGLFVVAATLLYGINLNLVKYHLSHLKPITITSFSIVSILPITLYILFVNTEFLSHLENISQFKSEFTYVFILGVLGTSIATLIFYNLIKIKDTVFASMVTYLMPIVAIAFGVLDGEKINLTQLLGMLLILLGVYVNGRKD